MQTDVAGILAELRRRGDRLAVAESLTGGLISAVIVAVPGASQSYLGAEVVYQPELKHEFLGVSADLIKQKGVINAEVAAQMAIGVREKFAKACDIHHERVIGLATTGVAGPDTQDGQPVGLVFVAIAGFIGDIDDVRVYELYLEGDRNDIRGAAAAGALEHLAEYLAI